MEVRYSFIPLLVLAFSFSAQAALNITEASGLPAGAALTIPSGTNGSSVLAAGNAKGQTFTFAGAAHLDGMVFRVGSVTTASDFKLEVYALNNGLPTGNALFSDTGTLPNTLVTNDFVQVDFPSTLDLAAGSYAVTFETTGSNLNLRLTSDDPYSGGRVIRKNGSSGNVWANGGNASTDIVCALLGSIDGDPPTRPMASSGPNIIFILADDLGWTDHNVPSLALGNQSDYYQTPNITRLATEGVSFNSAYAQPNCAPTRAALFTGQYSPRTGNGVYNVASLNRAGGGRATYTTPANQGDEHVNGNAETITLAEAMYNSGYVTAHFGKYHVGSSTASSDTHPLMQGFDFNFGGGNPGNPGNYFASSGTFHGNVGPELDPFGANYDNAYITDKLTPYANGNNPSSLNGTAKHLTDAMGDAFVAFMDSHRAGSLAAYPVYVQLHFYAVHTPIQARPDLVTKYNGLPDGANHGSAGYAALLENMDHSIGRVLDYLDDPNGDGNTGDSIADNTLVIFTSDNGGHMGPTSNVPLRGRKGMHYEGGIRVPLVLRMPGTIPAGETSSSMVHSVDHYRSILDFASGLTPDASTHPLDGESYFAHAKDPENVARNRSPIFYHFPGYMDSRAYNCSMMLKEIDGKRYKYIYAYDPYYDPGSDSSTGSATRGFDQYQLYNITEDIGETVNLLDYIDVENSADPNDPSSSREYWDWLMHRDLGASLASELNSWLQGAAGDSTWNPIYGTYKSTFPGIDPSLVNQSTGPAPASLPTLEVPADQQFRILNHSINGAGDVTLTFPSHAGYTYQIQGSSLLDGSDWDDLGSTVTPSTGSQTTHTANDPDAGELKRFYRVIMVTPPQL